MEYGGIHSVGHDQSCPQKCMTQARPQSAFVKTGISERDHRDYFSNGPVPVSNRQMTTRQPSPERNPVDQCCLLAISVLFDGITRRGKQQTPSNPTGRAEWRARHFHHRPVFHENKWSETSRNSGKPGGHDGASKGFSSHGQRVVGKLG